MDEQAAWERHQQHLFYLTEDLKLVLNFDIGVAAHCGFSYERTRMSMVVSCWDQYSYSFILFASNFLFINH